MIKSKLLLLALALSLASMLTACEKDKDAAQDAKNASDKTNTQLLSDEELQKKIQDRR